ncbi:hypothetical protein Emin_1169 [Elusimicrobium minutum Pei191]|uniref:Uncharacterized protein n=1 Tax=Elusimicrobium minutum (strain Pei191) TaxID=445932 RepID=B2KDX4_ELUMP|nr:hypothetical protein [Elusimicrobium minutum]ACC98720.1 hypothetical protein Emin_1169 [Elusimicrobium minutum Pei191]
MKKLLTVFIFTFLALPVFCACDGVCEESKTENCTTCKEAGKDIKTPTDAFDMGAFSQSRKEKDKAEKEIETLKEKYKTASAKEKPAVKAELNKFMSAQHDKKIKAQRLQIERQQEKLKSWAEALNEQEKNKKELISKEVDDILAGKNTKTPWENLKEKKTKDAGSLKRKAMKSAAKANK